MKNITAKSNIFLFVNFYNTISYFLKNNNPIPMLPNPKYIKYPKSVSKYFIPKFIYYLEKTIIKEYICRINHCDIRNIIDRVFETFYCDAEGLRKMKIVCSIANPNSIITVWLFYGDLS